MRLRTVIYDALDGFARGLGVEGEHPFETALRENYHAKVMNEFLAKPFPEGKSVKQKAAFLFDFAERIYRASENTIFLHNRCRAAEKGNAIFFQNELPPIIEKCRAQDSAFAAFLNRCIRGEAETEIKEALERQIIKNNEALEADREANDAFLDAVGDESAANAALNGKRREIEAAKTEDADPERLKVLDQELAQLEENAREIHEKLIDLSEPRVKQSAILSISGWFGLQMENQNPLSF